MLVSPRVFLHACFVAPSYYPAPPLQIVDHLEATTNSMEAQFHELQERLTGLKGSVSHSEEERKEVRHTYQL